MTEAGWTREKPTVAGWYWWRRKYLDNVFIPVYWNGHFAYVQQNLGQAIILSCGDGEWSSTPIARPQGEMMLLTDKEIEQLKAFYNVQTDRELIGAMDSHLTKLQSKLWKLQGDEPAIRQVRA